MALYTPLTDEQLAEVARQFDVGQVTKAIGIPEGSINTNYALETTRGRFFLRHTTVRTAEDLSFEAALLAHLHEANFPCPRWLPTVSGRPFFELANGRASLFHYLSGEERTRAGFTSSQAESLGRELAKMHRETASFSKVRPNPYGFDTVHGWVAGLSGHPDPEVAVAAMMLKGALAKVSQGSDGLCPRGVIHADLFMDNVKWLGDRVSAFFDFEMACHDTYLLDVAITLNAWCFEGNYNTELCRAFLRAYQDERPLTEIERLAFWNRLLFGAVRYTASRIRDFHLSPLPPERLKRKDFRTYLARVSLLLDKGPSLCAAWL